MRSQSVIVAFTAISNTILILLVSAGVLSSLATSDGRSTDEVVREIRATPLPFTKNEGQWDKRVLYRVLSGGNAIWFCQEGITYQFLEQPVHVGSESFDTYDIGMDHDFARKRVMTDSAASIVVKATFQSGNPTVEIIGDDLLKYRCNFFLGTDSTRWKTDVPAYAQVTYRNVYPGVDAIFHGEDGKLRVTWRAASAAELSKIQIAFSPTDFNGRAEVSWIDPRRDQEKELKLTSAPDAAHSRSSTNEFHEIVSVGYSTLLGGTGFEEGTQTRVDQSGNMYVAGWTGSADFPLQGAYDTTFVLQDVFITKLTADGSALLFSTYLGGSRHEGATSLAIDLSGCMYVTGFTTSSDFPLANAVDSVRADWEAFVTKLSADGNQLEFSTYLGGVGWDVGYGIGLDDLSQVYVTGSTESADFPMMNAYDASYNLGRDVFITKLTASGSGFKFSTFIGGADDDDVAGIAVDSLGDAFVFGHTMSSDYPVQRAYDSIPNWIDGFITKISSDGDSLLFSTYLGGSNEEFAYGIDIDASGCTYVTGYTGSPDYPCTNAYDAVRGVYRFS